MYLGMDWLGFIQIKSSAPTSGQFWNDLWFLFVSFSSWTTKAVGVEDGVEAIWWQTAGTDIANEEIAFGNSVKTSGTSPHTWLHP